MFLLCSNGKKCFDQIRPRKNVSTELNQVFEFFIKKTFDRKKKQFEFLFRLCSIYASTFSTELGYVLSVLYLCFDCARPVFRLRSTYVLTSSTEIGYVSTMLDLFRLSRQKFNLPNHHGTVSLLDFQENAMKK